MVAVVAAALVLAPQAEANVTFFSDTGSVCTTTAPCWQAGMFGVLVGLGSSVGQSGYLTEQGGATDNIKGTGEGGDVGIGAGSFINTNPGNAAQNWAGPVDFADSGSSVSHTFTVPNSSDILTNVTLIGGTTVGNTNVTTALNQILSISNYWSAASGQHELGVGTAAFTGGTTIGTIGGGIQVFSVNSLNLTSVLTIQGGANDIIIINDPSNAIFTKNVTLAGGITPDQVLFNIYGTVGTILSINGGGGAHSTIMGDIITRGAYYATAATVDGRILGGYGTILWGNNFEMDVPNDVAPEPAEYAMLAGGFAVLFYFGRRARLKSRLPMSGRLRARIQADGEERTGDVPRADTSAITEDLGSEASISEPGLTPPRDGGGGGSGGVDRALTT